ncbi:hypothetical protein JKP88DRAFT_254240 [Tribonema minus]|uniref:Uncharacterized protein n=1 Tax=Tribonema minus TaxID=303371 RepID=A0A836CJ01_9STRA|nr:hypothetical protein JKP88DRAFT_254240 [Tribonema minus]
MARCVTATYSVVWWYTYLINVLVLFSAVMLHFQAPYYEVPPISRLVMMILVTLLTNILVADIASDFICIFLALFSSRRHAMSKGRLTCPLTPSKMNKFLVIYCLKSNNPVQVQETLMILQASWRLNQTYSNATFCILSGTADEQLAAIEAKAVADWNILNAEEGGKVYYVRRMRSILFKYGQYLDFIMLLNGYKEPMLYKDIKSRHPSGLCFDPTSDIDHFCGSDYEFLAIMDRDNMLSTNFFMTANEYFLRYPDLQILQPAVTPFPKHFRRAIHGGESYYTSLGAKFQVFGNELAELKRVYIPCAAFYGKGIIRRSAYNITLLGWDPATGRTQEERNIPRDLISHDIIESSVMKTMLVPDITVYEEFPTTHVEWHLRQNRWGSAYGVTDGMWGISSVPILCSVSDDCHSCTVYASQSWLLDACYRGDHNHRRSRAFYQHYFAKARGAIYSSTFNLRCILLKPTVLFAMGAFAVLKTESINTVYMGVVDIMFGSFRCFRALWKLCTRSTKWLTFESLGATPLQAMLVFTRAACVELAIAVGCLALLVLRGDIQERGANMAAVLMFLFVVITFPAYVYVTAYKTGHEPEIPENEDPRMVDALTEMLVTMRKLGGHDIKDMVAFELTKDGAKNSKAKPSMLAIPNSPGMTSAATSPGGTVTLAETVSEPTSTTSSLTVTPFTSPLPQAQAVEETAV